MRTFLFMSFFVYAPRPGTQGFFLRILAMEHSRRTHIAVQDTFRFGPSPIFPGRRSATVPLWIRSPRLLTPTYHPQGDASFLLSFHRLPATGSGISFSVITIHVIRRKPPITPEPVAYPGGSLFHLAIPRGPTAFCPHIHTRRRRDGGANEATEPSVAPSQAEDRFCNRRSPKVFTTKDQRRERRRTTRMDGRHACF